MKKVSLLCVFLFTVVAFNAKAQTSTANDFFAGKWEITVFGTPQGDSKMLADLVRKDGTLTGQLSNLVDPSAEKIPLTIVENGDKLSLDFISQGYDVTIDLTKVDNDNLKGTLLNMFETNAKRLK